MKKALVYGKWELDFESFEYENSVGEKQSYIQRLVNGESIVSDCVLAGAIVIDEISKELPKGLDVLELYGGAGFQTMVLQKILEPSCHTVVEIDKTCTEHLRRNFPDINVIKGDANDNYKRKADYYSFDWNSWTINTFAKNHDMFEYAASNSPAVIQFWDNSKSYFYSNRVLYSKIFGTELKTPHDYVVALSNFMLEKIGYSLSIACYAKYSTYMVLRKGPNDELKEFSTSTNRNVKGISWI